MDDAPPGAPEGGDEEQKLEQKTVSFFFGDENSNPNKGTDTPVSKQPIRAYYLGHACNLGNCVINRV